ncbi:MAG TPA: hypothetical protein PKW05_08935 [Anaerolineae bacterium]|nr:hypothetical protein [Anaerolineae bacterium]HQJ51884.1 hypothetical protein [Anaerolineae bacterium]
MTEATVPPSAPLPSLQHLWAVTTPVEDLPGRWVKLVDVPPEGFGIVEDRRGTTRVLDKGQSPVGGLGYRLAHLSAPSNVAVAVIRNRSLTVHPSVPSLLSADNLLVEADWLVKIEVEDAARAYGNLIRPEQVVPLPKLTLNLSSQADPRLRHLVKEYLRDDLLHNPQVSDRLAGDLAGFLRTYLKDVGLKVVAVEQLTFLSMEDQLARAARLREFQQALREEKLRAQMQVMKEQYQLREYADRLEHDYELDKFYRADELSSLKADIEHQRIEPAQAVALVEQRLAQVSQAESEREQQGPQQLAARLEAQSTTPQLSFDSGVAANAVDERGLRKFASFLRYAGMIIASSVTLVAVLWPDRFVDERLTNLITAAAGLLVAVMTFLSADWVGNQVRVRRERWLAERAAGGLSPEARRRADRLLRAEVAGLLQRTADRVRAAKEITLRDQRRDLAADLKQLENRLGMLSGQAEVMVTVFGEGGTRLAGEVEALTDAGEKLMTFAQQAMELSTQVHESAQAGQVDAIAPLLPQLDNMAMEIKHALEDRQRLLGAN